jgi:hypothetical protein
MQYARMALATTSRLERWSALDITPQSLPFPLWFIELENPQRDNQ